MDQEKIGMFIAHKKKKKNMTQQDLADKLGVSNKTVGNWENGRNMPDLSLFRPLCNELGISADELILGERIGKNDNKKEEVKKIVNDIVDSNPKEKVTVKKILLDLFTEEVFENSERDEPNQAEEHEKVFSILSIILINLISILSVVFIKQGENSWLKFCPWLIGLISIVYIITITDKDKIVDRISKILCYIIVVLITVFFIKFVKI